MDAETATGMSKTALITGGATGIGAAIARRFFAAGWRIAVADISDDFGFDGVLTSSAPTPRVLVRRLDVRRRESVAAFVGEAERHFGAIDLVVPCAGIHRHGPSATFEWSAWDDILETNLNGCYAIIKAALPGMLSRGTGRIITIASELGIAGAAESAAYCASKGAVISLTKALARECAPAGVLVNSIAPGPVATGMLMAVDEYASGAEAELLPIGRYGLPDEIAAVAEALSGDAGTYMVGQIVSPNGGAVI
ncbi:SDR family NAD(P)-dependent oxidoreductase [Mycolicibacterium sp. YH-1]|uniref:SDR family NAD(P)-dependent oxidoreductase n=1 Tax=Mycolicibacterium sp. YH-1 TaxID=2908837 RepID=UPI001F4C3DAE|nr:SDR family oxidoreductase [Mycolicibacterium sp. YH-1]UNB50811.1 SDR family oxidoreductase [Mycolicibacterium sp. YH-1]